MMRISLFLTSLMILCNGVVAFAADAIPQCTAYGRPLAVNNDQVLHWKRTTPNQFRERGNVTGVVSQIFNDKNGHDHFVINIGKYDQDNLEVIYNQDFGAIPDPVVGMQVQACGDYITSTAPSGPYPASPVGAIIHWIHMNPSGRGHDPGFLVLNGQLCGQDASNAGPKPYPNPKKPKNGRHGIDLMNDLYTMEFTVSEFEDAAAFEISE